MQLDLYCVHWLTFVSCTVIRCVVKCVEKHKNASPADYHAIWRMVVHDYFIIYQMAGCLFIANEISTASYCVTDFGLL